MHRDDLRAARSDRRGRSGGQSRRDAGCGAGSAEEGGVTSTMRTVSLTLFGLTLIAALAHAQATPPATPAAATTPTAGTPAPPAAPTASGAPAAEASPADDKSSAAEPQGFTYNPEGRRDPFVSLLRRGDSRNTGPKMAGLGGLGTSEV